MEIGVGLNATIPGVSGVDVLDWAATADEGPFSSLGIIDRITYPNHEPLVTLAAAAGATNRIRLTTTVLVSPIRPTGLLAKQAATVDSLSGGRLTLGLGIGSRQDDYLAADAPAVYGDRASHYEDQLDQLRAIWSGEPHGDAGAPIGPSPATYGGPEILLGGYSEAAARRAGEVGDGFIAGNLPPDDARGFYETARAAYEEAGRDGSFRFVVCGYWTLGGQAERGRDYLRDYYGFREGMAERAADSLVAGEEAVHQRLDEAEEAGVDEIILWPSVPDLDQLELFAELVDDRS